MQCIFIIFTPTLPSQVHSPPPCPFPTLQALFSCLNKSLRQVYAAPSLMGVATLWNVVNLPQRKVIVPPSVTINCQQILSKGGGTQEHFSLHATLLVALILGRSLAGDYGCYGFKKTQFCSRPLPAPALQSFHPLFPSGSYVLVEAIELSHLWLSTPLTLRNDDEHKIVVFFLSTCLLMQEGSFDVGISVCEK